MLSKFFNSTFINARCRLALQNSWYWAWGIQVCDIWRQSVMGLKIKTDIFIFYGVWHRCNVMNRTFYFFIFYRILRKIYGGIMFSAVVIWWKSQTSLSPHNHHLHHRCESHCEYHSKYKENIDIEVSIQINKKNRGSAIMN
jgi:hypothetical protein